MAATSPRGRRGRPLARARRAVARRLGRRARRPAGDRPRRAARRGRRDGRCRRGLRGGARGGGPLPPRRARPRRDGAAALPGLDQAVTWLTDLGGTVGMPVIALVAVAVMTWRWRAWTPVVLTTVAAAGSVAMTVAGKDLVGRARPPLTLAVPPYETSPSFPSGHSLNAVVVVGVLVYLVLPHLHRKRTAPCSSSPARSSPRPSGSAGLPRPPLADRRRRRVAARARLARGRRHRAPAAADRAAAPGDARRRAGAGHPALSVSTQRRVTS